MKITTHPIVLPIVLLLVLAFAGTPGASAQTFNFYLGQEVSFYIETTSTPNSTVNFTLTQSPSGIVGYALPGNDYTETLVVPVVTNGSGYGRTYFNVKALDVGSTTYSACAPGNCSNALTFRVATVASVEISALDSPITDNPNSGGGKRIYPDRTTPTDTVDRKRVRVTATLDIPIANSTVYFKSFDLDDPSADSSPIDANASAANDNRGAPQAGVLSNVGASGTVNTVSVTTDGSGVARADFSVTMQPGDNFMIAASVDESFLTGLVADGVNLRDAGGNPLPVAKAKASVMLTVWRKLYIEVDRTLGPGAVNRVAGTVTGTITVPKKTGQNVAGPLTVVNVNPALPLGLRRFETGRMTSGASSLIITENTATSFTVVNITNRNITLSDGSAFVAYDDDDHNADDSAMSSGSLNVGTYLVDGDNSEPLVQHAALFRYLNTTDGTYADGKPMNVYASAYVMPEYNWAQTVGYNQTNVPFDLNVAEDQTNSDELTSALTTTRDSRDHERVDFWVAYFLIGYQGREDRDADGCEVNPNTMLCQVDAATMLPLPEGGVPGISKRLIGTIGFCDCYASSSCPVATPPANAPISCTTLPTGSFGSLIYQEVQQDVFRSWLLAGSTTATLPTTAPHELGHQFGLAGDATRQTLNFMDYSLANNPNPMVLHPEHINLVRSRVMSPGA